MKLSEEPDESRYLFAILGSHALAKSCEDPFMYALKLRTGEVIEYESAEVLANENWLKLKGIMQTNSQPFLADRGMDVRISDIVWVMDAPHGS